MTFFKPDRFVGQNLKDCYAELQEMGGLRTWAPYCLDSDYVRQVEVRFNNHWGTLADPGAIEYLVTITDGKGQIVSSNVYPLSDLQSYVACLKPGDKQTSLSDILPITAISCEIIFESRLMLFDKTFSSKCFMAKS